MRWQIGMYRAWELEVQSSYPQLDICRSHSPRSKLVKMKANLRQLVPPRLSRSHTLKTYHSYV